MCVVSMIGDHYNDKWSPYKKSTLFPDQSSTSITYNFEIPVSRTEFEKLKKEVQDMKELLIKAKLYDEKNNEPNCEMESKMAFLKEIAKAVGVDLEEVFKPK
jgi:hypothetical protein